MKAVTLILEKPAAMKEIIAAALTLTGARFESQRKTIFHASSTDDMTEHISSFRFALAGSTLPEEEKSVLSSADDQQICDLARKIAVGFTRKEIKQH